MNCSPIKEIREVPRAQVWVNGVEIPYDEIAREVQFHPASSPVQAWKAAARALAVRLMLLHEARNKNVVPQPTVDARGLSETEDEAIIRQLIEQEVITPKPDKASCQRYYEQNENRFTSPIIFEASHIFLKAVKSDVTTYLARRAEAERLIERLSDNPCEFGNLALEYSDCPSAQQRGNLGQLQPGQTTPEFESELYSMSPGYISSKPVESRYGIHIIHLHQRIEGRKLPFDAVRDRISNYLRDRVERIAIAQYIARLMSKIEVSGVEMPNSQDMRVY